MCFWRRTGLQEAYDTYGLQELHFEILETAVVPDLLDQRELHWMTEFKAHQQGYNSQTEHDRLVERIAFRSASHAERLS